MGSSVQSNNNGCLVVGGWLATVGLRGGNLLAPLLTNRAGAGGALGLRLTHDVCVSLSGKVRSRIVCVS